MQKYLLILLLSLSLFGQEIIWKEKPNGGKFAGYEAAQSYSADFFYAVPDTDGTVYTSKEFSLNYWEGQLNSALKIDSLVADTTGDDTLRLVSWLDVWDGIQWVPIKIIWDTLATNTYSYDSLSAYQDTLIFTKTDFNLRTYYFSTARVFSNSYLGFLDIYYTRIRWRLEFLETGSTFGHCYLKQTFNYWQKGK